MRLKERGLGTGAIVGIVVAVVVVVIVVVAAAVLLVGGGHGLPVYSGAAKVGEDINYMGLSASVYTADNGQTAYDWYKSNTPTGWTLYQDSGYISSYGGSITWEKGDQYSFVVILENQSLSYYGGSGTGDILILASGPKSAFTA